MTKIETYLATTSIVILTFLSGEARSAAIDDARSSGQRWLLQSQLGDGGFGYAQGLSVQTTSAAVEAMQLAGLSRSPQFARAVAWLASVQGESIDARAWQVMALAAAGRDAALIANQIRDERNNFTLAAGAPNSGAAWGPYSGYAATLPDTALALGALRSSGLTYSNDLSELTVSTLCTILPAQLAVAPWSGSWMSVAPQTKQPTHLAQGSLLSTSLTLYELKKQRQSGRFSSLTVCSRTSPGSIDTSIGSAKIWLLAQANQDGGFSERDPQTTQLGSSDVLATALAIRALVPFAADGDSAAAAAISNARNWLVSQQLANGSWGTSALVTARVLAAMPSANGADLTDTDNDGVTDVVEARLGTRVDVADSQRDLPTTGGAEQPGVNAAGFAMSGTLGEVFAYGITATGGSPPYSFTIKQGVLPPGLSLSPNGQISGTPAAPGSYAFDYEVTDASHMKVIVIGRIDISQAYGATGSDGDVPLPGWALFALGSAMLTAIRRKQT